VSECNDTHPTATKDFIKKHDMKGVSLSRRGEERRKKSGRRSGTGKKKNRMNIIFLPLWNLTQSHPFLLLMVESALMRERREKKAKRQSQ
jgi:hypothetical protein